MKRLSIPSSKFDEIIKEAITVLRDGGLIIFPTETCYGIGCDATNPDAVTKMLAYKKRREGKAVSIAVPDEKTAKQYVEVNKTAENLYQTFLPGPITVISKSLSTVDPRLEAENGTLGIRIPDYAFTLELLKQFGKPISATSANVAHQKTPYSYDDIANHTTKTQQAMIDLFLDAGQLPHNPSSTVVDTTLNEEKILRQGEITLTAANSYISTKEQETREIARKFYHSHIKPLSQNACVVVSLHGDLGAGKTQFTKGIAHALGIQEEIVSPTFNIVREYAFDKKMLYHVDTWRLHEQEGIEEFLPSSYFEIGNIVVIEWAEKIFQFLEKLEKEETIQILKVQITSQSLEKRTINF